MRLTSFKSFFNSSDEKRPIFSLLLVFLFVLPFLEGGTHFAAEVLILILPLPLFLLGTATKEINWKKFFGWPIIFWLAFLVFIGISVINSASLLFSIPAFFQLLAIFLFFILFLSVLKKEDLIYDLGSGDGTGTVENENRPRLCCVHDRKEHATYRNDQGNSSRSDLASLSAGTTTFSDFPGGCGS